MSDPRSGPFAGPIRIAGARRVFIECRGRRGKIELRVSCNLRAAARVSFRLEHVTSGRLVKTQCIKPTRTNRRRPRCTRLSPLQGFTTRALRAGANTITITRPSLPPGTDKLIATPSAAGHTGRRQQATITITA